MLLPKVLCEACVSLSEMRDNILICLGQYSLHTDWFSAGTPEQSITVRQHGSYFGRYIEVLGCIVEYL